MPRFTPAQFADWCRRRDKSLSKCQFPELFKDEPGEGVERESDLHEQIIDYCKSKGWIVLRSNPARPTGRQSGEPDFDIAAEGGRRYWVECKSSQGKLSIEQQSFIAHAKRLGHDVRVVRTFPQFLDLLS